MINPINAHTVIGLSPAPSPNQPDSELLRTNAATQVIENQESEKTSTSVRKNPWEEASKKLQLPDQSSSLDKALEQLNNEMKAWATGLRFDIDPDTQRIVMSIVDNDNGEVIRTVPSDAVLAVAKMIADFQGQGINTQA